MLHVGDGGLETILILLLRLLLLPPNMASEVYTRKLYFGLFWIIQVVIGKLQTYLDMCRLEQGNLAHTVAF